MPTERRMATLIAFLSAFETSALDDALDLLDMLITSIAKQAKLLGEKKRLRTLKDLDQAAISLRKACAIILDNDYEDKNLREAIFASVERSSIENAVTTIDQIARPKDGRSRVDHLPISMSAVLIADACNIGLGPLVKSNNSILSRDRLSWIQQNYFRSETLAQANACLVDYHSTISLAQVWGGGEVASADGLRFVTPLRTINAGYNPKYFGSKKGITYYNYTSDQFTGFHGIVIPGTLKDSIYILEGLLEQQTSLQIAELMADTAGVSNLIFGLFWLLGYQFSPRLADICETTLCRIDPDADYGVFNELNYKKINVHRIKENFDDMFRVAGSLKMGTVSASELIKSLLRSDRPSSLTKAISELGKIPKTIYMLNYIDDEAYRRRILNQINRGEGRHSLARFICHGQRGEIRKRYREGQEDQLSALGLVTNAVVLWNTMYIQKALAKLRKEGLVINEEDVARLSPLQYKHVNVLGHYSFTLSEEVLKGELRELHHTDYE